MKRCDGCEFWSSSEFADGFGNLQEGVCHRYPPSRDTQHETPEEEHCAYRVSGWMWPVTYADDWCGEFQNKGAMIPHKTPHGV